LHPWLHVKLFYVVACVHGEVFLNGRRQGYKSFKSFFYILHVTMCLTEYGIT